VREEEDTAVARGVGVRAEEEREEVWVEAKEAGAMGEDSAEECLEDETEGGGGAVGTEGGEGTEEEGRGVNVVEEVGTEVVRGVETEEETEEETEVVATEEGEKMVREGHRENRDVCGRRVVRRIPMDTSSPPGTFHRGGGRST